MKRPVVALARPFVVAIALVSLAPFPATGQRPSAANGGTADVAREATPWTPPRTPWGDPDLQGNFTNKSEHLRGARAEEKAAPR